MNDEPELPEGNDDECGGYGMVWECTYERSMMGAGEHVHALWPYILSSKSRNGLINLHPKALATIIGSTEERMAAAIAYLLQDDPESHSPAEGGKRLIQKGPFQYFVVNHQKYRKLAAAQQKRSGDAKRQADKRERDKEKSSKPVGLTGGNMPEPPAVPHGTSTGTPAAEIPTSHIPTKDQAKAWLEDAVEKGGNDYTWAEVQRAYLYLGSIGWMTGRDKKVPCVDWRLMLEGQIQKDRDHDASNSGSNGKGSGQPKAADRPRVFPESHQKYGCESGYTADKLRAKAIEDGLPMEAVEEYLKYRQLKGL